VAVTPSAYRNFATAMVNNLLTGAGFAGKVLRELQDLAARQCLNAANELYY
jgi:hypothetical protein